MTLRKLPHKLIDLSETSNGVLIGGPNNKHLLPPDKYTHYLPLAGYGKLDKINITNITTLLVRDYNMEVGLPSETISSILHRGRWLIKPIRLEGIGTKKSIDNLFAEVFDCSSAFMNGSLFAIEEKNTTASEYWKEVVLEPQVWAGLFQHTIRLTCYRKDLLKK